MSFDSLGLNPDILRAIAEQGYREPTPIQQQAIPAVLEGRDLMASAQTGTGKTAGFTLPLLQHLITHQPHAKGRRPVRALILTPTRELAAQIGENVRDYSKYLNIRSLVVFGGVSINPQMMKLRGGVDVLVATPGRLLDLEHQNAVKLDQIEILVLDEADRMLDMGFIHDIRRVLAKLPSKRQNLLFSATFSDDIKALAEKLLHNPLEIEVARRNTASEQVTQHVHFVDKKRKRELLSQMIGQGNWQQVLVFTRTKHGANHLAEQLNKDGIRSAAIHGNKSQGARTVRWPILNPAISACWWRRILRRVAWILKNCRTWSTMNCRTCRKIMYTVLAVPVARRQPARRCRWSVLTNISCCVISKSC
ncbi:ATP-dependent RNA helicase rhlE [Salmonella enterica subsp. arizonae]|uniref:DEAD-box ATP-dependent RNA helicase RhpA n=1 Tax=Salmonella enterica subsp. arizonae TaxID=59203 RepID=A0A3S4G941_SALER|nr:ATP-dependent RNA helicase rhlE [Salmonella enterica subsp. arizonae]